MSERVGRSRTGLPETLDGAITPGLAIPQGSGRVGLISLGCPKNLVDSEIMLGRLRQQGFEVVSDIETADTVIVNTCGFIDEARQESIDTILEVADRKKAGVKRLYVAGCMVNRYAADLASEIPEIDGFVSLDQLEDVGNLVALGSVPPPSQAAAHRVFDHTAPRVLATRGYAYLKVAEGCNNPCTFCAIPVWRGRFRSRSIDDLVVEARRLEAEGVLELCLLAQDTTRYGEDIGLGKHGLLRLVEALLAKTNFPWIRFLYAYPTTLDLGLADLMAVEPRLCAYLDIPLQHSHPEVLRWMRRGGSGESYLRLLAKLREKAPGIWIRTTFIVGFPGETEEHFEHLLEFIAQAQFDHAGAFVYSVEQDTPSAALPNRVPRRVGRQRRQRLLAAQEGISLARRRNLIGKVLPMLLEGVCEESEHLLQARHQGMAPEVDGRVLINDGLAPASSLVEVEITEAYADDLVGRIVGPRGVSNVRVSEAVLAGNALGAGIRHLVTGNR